MVMVEQLIESAMRTGIRTALTSASATVPLLDQAKIITFWNGPEERAGLAPDNDASGLLVMIIAHPCSASGYQPGIGLMPQRDVQVDVMIVSQPDDDESRAIFQAFYKAVRGVFDASTPGFTLPSGITLGGYLISGTGSGEIENLGQVASWSLEMKVSV